MPILTPGQERKRGRRWAWVAVVVLGLLLFGVIPWHLHIRRYWLYHIPGQWAFGRFGNSISSTDMVEVECYGPFQIVYRRAKVGFRRLW